MAKFKVGDRVTANGKGHVNVEKHWNEWFRKDYGDIVSGALVVVSVAEGGGSNIGLSNKVGRARFYMPAHMLKPAVFSIEAGKFYRTRDGRKVGPMKWSDGRWFVKGALGTWNSDGTPSNHHRGTASEFGNLIAEWIDDAPVKVIASVQCDALSDEYGSGVAAPANPAIVCLIEGGRPKPAARPHVHTSREAAVHEAKRLAEQHKGQEFRVYVQTDSVKDLPVYAHEWQRLAASGEKRAAIRVIQALTGLEVSQARLAVNQWHADNTARRASVA